MTDREYKDLSVKEFTKAAKTYEADRNFYAMCKKDYPDILEEIEKEPWESLLDAGCGPAPMIALLSDKYPDRRYTGIDLTLRMIEQAQKKKIPNATFLVGDCENLPFAENSFDVIICANSFHHYPNPQNFFDSVHKVLNPNGRLILRDFTGNAFMLWLCNHLEMPLAHLLGHGDVALRSENEVRTWCENADLTVERFERRKGMRMHCVVRKNVTMKHR